METVPPLPPPPEDPSGGGDLDPPLAGGQLWIDLSPAQVTPDFVFDLGKMAEPTAPQGGDGQFALPQTHAEWRQRLREFAATDPDIDLRSRWVLGLLYGLFDNINARCFGGQMIVPVIDLTEPAAPNALGDWGTRFSGIRGRIRIRPSLLVGEEEPEPGSTKKPKRRPGPLKAGDRHFVGRVLYTLDVFLHEMLHAVNEELHHRQEKGDHGHGTGFADLCNQVGGYLGLRPVAARKKRRPGDEPPVLQNCAQWPHNVRPLSYYRGAVRISGTERDKDKAQPSNLGEMMQIRRAAPDILALAMTLPPRDQYVVLMGLYESVEAYRQQAEEEKLQAQARLRATAQGLWDEGDEEEAGDA